MPSDNGALLHLESIRKVYQMGEVEVEAIKDVTLKIYPGEFVAIVGPSGSGKTTMLNITGCLDLPSHGEYYLQGKDMMAMNDKQISQLRGEGLGFVFQNYSLLNRATALTNVEMPYLYKHRSGNRERAKELLEAVGLGDRLNHCPTEMSGGQQQRVAVARALMNNPFLLLADEPTGNLDTHSGQELMDLFDKLNQEQGLTIIMVTHDVDVSERAKRIVHMRDGLIEHDQIN